MNEVINDKLTKVLVESQIEKHKTRREFIVSLILALINCRKVQFSELALHINSAAKTESIERRIQAFFKSYKFDYKKVCLLLSLFLQKGKLTLSIDRTEWDFGKYQCNILMIVAQKGTTAIPLYWELLDNNSGNSNSLDRIALLEEVIAVIGKKRIACIVGDREFIGIKWVKYLKVNNINFCMRIPKSHGITLKNGSTCTIDALLTGKETRYFCDVLVDGIVTNMMVKKLKPKKGKNEYLFLIGNIPSKELGKVYRLRWSIETLFQQFKGRGFDLESTHLQCPEKLKKLLALVSIAVAVCICIGEIYHEKVKKIKNKNHGYMANSFFRKGLDLLRRGLKYYERNLRKILRLCLEILTEKMFFHKSHSQ